MLKDGEPIPQPCSFEDVKKLTPNYRHAYADRPTTEREHSRGGATMQVAIIAVLLSMVSGVPALATTFVYVSNAEDGDIGMYTLQPDGSLHSGPRFKAEKLVMPMAVSPDK